ncbi:MAG: HipA domain-containing protein [Gammaproteobacteria bacterium]|nr:HipA domain-containing protein [Gammaproteobacteria bacterium]
MKLRWYLHDTHCLTMETGGGKSVPAVEWRSPALRRVSAGWDRAPERHTIDLWLRGALPENGAYETFEMHALRTIADYGLEIGAGTIHDWAWGNAHWEYPGALQLEREEDLGSVGAPDGYTQVAEDEVGTRLRIAAAEADRVRRLRRETSPHRKSSLSGAQGKIALHIDSYGRWQVPTGRSLTTWIVKVENRPDWPGEAGVESVCQRALVHLGLEAAATMAQVIDGIPVVMSQRSDRIVHQGRVVARHQEDWLQAFGRNLGFKSDEHGPALGFKSLYAIMRRYGDETGLRQITRLLAATCAMCNGDLHRKNVALAHGPVDEPFKIRLAPIYDFSSQCGVPRTGDALTIGIAGVVRAWDVREGTWRELAKDCRLDPDETVSTVRDIARRAAEALATARDEARGQDEWKDPQITDRRIEAVIGAVRKYARIVGSVETRGATARPPGRDGFKETSQDYEHRRAVYADALEGVPSDWSEPTLLAAVDRLCRAGDSRAVESARDILGGNTPGARADTIHQWTREAQRSGSPAWVELLDAVRAVCERRKARDGDDSLSEARTAFLEAAVELARIQSERAREDMASPHSRARQDYARG